MPRTKIKKAAQQAKKYFSVHKKIYRKSTFITIGLIIIVLIIIAININIKVLFDTETRITITPSIKSITINDKTAPNITYTTSIEKLRICDIICNATLIDSSNNKIISTESTSSSLTKTYTLPLIGRGRGQSIYNYHISCTTTDKKICPSKGKTYTKTAFVTLSYGLSPEEEELQKELEQILQEPLIILARTTTTLHSITSMSNKIAPRITITKEKTEAALLQKKLEDLKQKEEDILRNWNEEEFETTHLLLSEYKKLLTQTNTQTNTLHETLTRMTENYNNAVITLHSIHKQNISNITPLIKQTNDIMYQELLAADKQYQELLNTTSTPELFTITSNNIQKNINKAKLAHQYAKEQKEISFTALKAKYGNITNNTFTGTCENLKEVEENYNNTQDINAYYKTYCNETKINLFTTTPPNSIIIEKIENVTPNKTPEPLAYCCYQENCAPCGREKKTPIVLVHGHAFSKSASPELAFARLANLQQAFYKDGYIDASIINEAADIESIPPGEWGKQSTPIVISITYYYLQHYDLGELSFTTRKTDSIESYAIRLKESIDIIKEKTESDKVIIIAHSMGGLVAREYISLFGEENVEKLIILGSPNHGIQGDVKKYCTVTGAKKECNDMAYDSTFIKTLNNQKNNPSIPVYTIRAEGCPTDLEGKGTAPGDGVILAESVKLDFAIKNYIVNGSCNDVMGKSLHMDFVNPKIHQETYELIGDILKE
jgi:hypothetical protein